MLAVFCIAAGMPSANAWASETQAEAALQPVEPIAAYSDTDLNALFEQEAGKPMQLASLSQQEMKETEGAVLPFLIGAGIGLATYAAPLAYSAFTNARSGQGAFTSNFTNSWDNRQAIFSSSTGALSGGLANIALRSTGTIINYPSTTFLKSFHSRTQQFVNNQQRSWLTAPGLAIRGAASAGSFGANSWYNRISR